MPSHGEPQGTLLFVPGLSANTRSFPRLFDGLRKRFDLIAFDPRGAGQSTNTFTKFRLKDIADDAVAILDELDVQQAHVMGLSMGGMIAQEMALAHPERIADLVLCCTMCGNRPGRRPSPLIVGRLIRGVLSATGEARTAEGIAERFGPLLFAEGTPKELQVDFFGPRSGSNAPTKSGLVSQLLAVRSFGVHQHLNTVQHRTLVIHGNDDILVPTMNAQVLHDALPNSELALLPGGHVFFHEHPELFIQSLDRFFEAATSTA
ncbi:MAG: pimeloyl-ACP methyl ester carboxylesterase [Bradymonadia bacterium]|jgi:pimeloyl-ACP methyl ester carboxylesterase